MLAVTGGAMRGAHFRSLGQEYAVLTALVLAQQSFGGAGCIGNRVVMAGAAQRRHLVGRGDAIRISPAARLAMTHAFPVTGIAGKRRLRVWMTEKIRRDFAVAGFAEFVDSLLPARRGNAEQQRQ
jgi:hypothetical protein